MSAIVGKARTLNPERFMTTIRIFFESVLQLAQNIGHKRSRLVAEESRVARSRTNEPQTLSNVMSSRGSSPLQALRNGKLC